MIFQPNQKVIDPSQKERKMEKGRKWEESQELWNIILKNHENNKKVYQDIWNRCLQELEASFDKIELYIK